MQIDISSLPTEEESLRRIIATLNNQNQELSEQNNNWSSKYQKLEQEKSELSVSHIALNTRCLALEDNNNELLQKNTELSNYVALLGVCRIIYGNLLHNFYNSAILTIMSNICWFRKKSQSYIDNSQQFFLNISFFP